MSRCTCKSCGGIIPSFQSQCPFCGVEIIEDDSDIQFEIFEKELSRIESDIITKENSMFREFIMFLNTLLTFILIVAIPFIIAKLNILIPVIIALVLSTSLRPLMYKSKTEYEALINSFMVPNDRYSILRMILLIHDKIEFTIRVPYGNRSTKHMVGIWKSKLKSLDVQYEAIMSGDDKYTAIRGQIDSSINSYKNKLFRKRILISSISFIYLVFMFTRSIEFKRTIATVKGIEIPDTRLAKSLPPLDGFGGSVDKVSDEKIIIEVVNATENDFRKYVDRCKESGFTIDQIFSTYQYNAFNSHGEKIDILKYGDKAITIEINKAITLSDAQVPKSSLLKLLPELPSTKLNPISVEDDYVTLYVGETDIDKYNKYVIDSKSVFNTDTFTTSDNREFHGRTADNKYRVNIGYYGFNTMKISINKISD